jgi:ElaB/YqjD/DUF883 family membrane-anchored ribosome-binding protein
MGKTADRMRRPDGSLPPVSGGEQRPEAIREDVEETRAEMSETIDALQERLNPDTLKQEAKGAVRGATIGRAEEMVGTAQHRAEDVMSTTQERAKGASSGLVEIIRQNPLPAALAGVGLGWLMMESRKSSSQSHSSSQVQQKAGQAMGTAQQKTGQLTSQVQHGMQDVGSQAQQGMSQFQSMLHERPLAVGAVALGLGAAVGLAVPETEKEEQLLGQARDQVVHKAEQMAQDAGHRAKDAAEQTAGQVVKQAAGLSG